MDHAARFGEIIAEVEEFESPREELERLARQQLMDEIISVSNQLIEQTSDPGTQYIIIDGKQYVATSSAGPDFRGVQHFPGLARPCGCPYGQPHMSVECLREPC